MRRLAVIASFAALSACTAAPGPQPVNQSSGVQTPAHSGSAQTPAGPSGGPQTPAGGARTGKPGDPATDDPKAKELDDKVATLQAAYDKSPSDASAQKALADATFADANYYMNAPSLPPQVKYPRALLLYRKTAKLDPTNDQAKAAVAQIEDIYHQLNRPIPEV